MRGFELLLDLVFPPHCAFCGTLLAPGRNEGICDECQKQLSLCSKKHCCERCGKPIEHRYRLCRHCKIYIEQNFDKIRSVCVYTGCAKEGILAFKKNSMVESGVVFSKMLSEMVKHVYADVNFDFVAAVPPRRKRMREKHFDQAGFLARQTAKKLHIPYLRGLMFQKEIRKKQSGLGLVERFENVSGNFVVGNGKAIDGKTILVIDDVCTSRATLNECARALKVEGACAVYCATVATTA